MAISTTPPGTSPVPVSPPIENRPQNGAQISYFERIQTITQAIWEGREALVRDLMADDCALARQDLVKIIDLADRLRHLEIRDFLYFSLPITN